MNFNPLPIDVGLALKSWLLVCGGLLLVVLVIALLASLLRHRLRGPAAFVQGLFSFVEDMGSLSPRRILAIARLTVKEAIRRKALSVFVIFAVLLMFGAWFMRSTTTDPGTAAKNHITYVMTIISWMVLLVSVFLSCWSIPEDIRLRSLHTVVTTPTRRIEIVLGRILGTSLISVGVLAIMGLFAGVWVYRQVPANDRAGLTCRVPVFSNPMGFYFISAEGQPAPQGINVGDTWMHRSHIQGNSRARAVWLFDNITPERIGDVLNLEARFEAFRTVKGSEELTREGLEAQITLVNNPREEAFGIFALAATFRELADSLRDGEFRTAADRMESLSTRIRESHEDIPRAEYKALFLAYDNAGKFLLNAGFGHETLGQLMDTGSRLVDEAANDRSGAGDNAYLSVADNCDEIAAYLREHADELHEALPRLEVPLDRPIHVNEFHADGNRISFPRRILYAADYETQARFLAEEIAELNEAGGVLEGDRIRDSLPADLVEKQIVRDPLNADLLATVLQEELASGGLAVADGKLKPSGDRRWFAYFDDLIRRERLNSQVSEGWLQEVDLFGDLVHTEAARLRVEVACVNDQMYLGMARPDLFIRLRDASFFTGFSKALLIVALMMIVVVVIGVTASCIVKGPVAILFTFVVVLVGTVFDGVMANVVAGNEKVISSGVLLYQHRNPTAGVNASRTQLEWLSAGDRGIAAFVKGISTIIPDFTAFDRPSVYVENGFDIPFQTDMLPPILITLGFFIPCVLLATLFLKFRELEAK